MPPLDQLTSPNGHVNRREFLKLSGASLALGALSSCRNKMPFEKIFPFEDSIETIAGAKRFYATTFPVPGFVQGLLVESHNGHPTKIEGHPLHPASLGATSLFAQASIIDLYSPFRLKSTSGDAGWKISFPKTEALAILVGEVVSPTLAAQLTRLKKLKPDVRIYAYEKPLNADYCDIDFNLAKRIVSVDWDFLGLESDGSRLPMAYSKARSENDGTARLYCLESGVSLTGSKADHRFALSTSELVLFISDLEKVLNGAPAANLKVQALAKDLLQHRGASAVVAGFAQNAFVHDIVRRINLKLGNLQRVVRTRERSVLLATNKLEDFVNDVDAGLVKSVLILGGDPVQTAPRELELARRIRALNSSTHHVMIPNDTSSCTKLSIPETHYLEMWSDAVSSDGTESLVQPLLQPMHDALSSHDVINLLLGQTSNAYDTVRAYWKTRLHGSDFESAWRQALSTGVLKPTAKNRNTFNDLKKNLNQPTNEAQKSGLEIIFRPDLKVWDGRFAENPWLQELPHPLTQISWDNAVLISNELARLHELKNGDIAEIKTANGELLAAVFIQAGLPENTLSLSLGYGRNHAGTVAERSGFNAELLRSAKDEWRADVLQFEKTGAHYELASTQTHHDMGERDLILTVPPRGAVLLKEPVTPATDFGHGVQPTELPANLFDERQQWAMSIDTDSCIGCSVCVIACQSENNIPVVGKKMVMMGREMHWIRIDRYSKRVGEIAKPLPVTCMHCEKAPCEVVCPVEATTHSSTGLNQMTYNRCVGTRYCSNNCPYKVRRFNFYKFSENSDDQALQRNPEVTVRARGVMEKCTYCVQRIEATRIGARKENREVKDGEIRTACQAACPTRAITFGNLKDETSAVNRTRASKRTYGLLTALGARPRTTYLAAIVNPNPELRGDA